MTKTDDHGDDDVWGGWLASPAKLGILNGSDY
jgi:hypothetical protein